MNTDKYQTDSWILEIFDDWYDPCPLDYEQGDRDALDPVPWPHKTFVNPPYSNPLPFVKKAIDCNHGWDSMIVLLLKHDSSTEWYRLLHEAGAHFIMFHKRLKHGTGVGAPFPSVLAILEGEGGWG